MPTYKQSKSQKRSQSQSKNGRRRRKHTMRKLRRGKKSRKVMRGGRNYTVVINEVSPLPQDLISKLKGCTTSGNVEQRVYGFTPDFVKKTYNEIIPKENQTDTTPDDMREAIIKHVVMKTTIVTQLDMDEADIPKYLFKTQEQHLADAERGDTAINEYNRTRLITANIQ